MVTQNKSLIITTEKQLLYAIYKSNEQLVGEW